MKNTKPKIGKLLLESLTNSQIEILLDVVFSIIDIEKYIDWFKEADSDMSETLLEISKMDVKNIIEPSKTQTLRVASDQRIIEFWESLWRQWDNLVSEIGEEDGKYAVHYSAH